MLHEQQQLFCLLLLPLTVPCHFTDQQYFSHAHKHIYVCFCYVARVACAALSALHATVFSCHITKKSCYKCLSISNKAQLSREHALRRWQVALFHMCACCCATTIVVNSRSYKCTLRLCIISVKPETLNVHHFFNIFAAFVP